MIEEVLSNLLSMLDLDSGGPDVFRGRGPGGSRRRLFGGHVAAQALMAMGRTVAAPAHSLHAYFLRPGDPHRSIEYQVTRLRDGRSFATRTVVASQNGEIIFHASASFAALEHGFEHQAPAPPVPPPSACISWDAWVGPRLAQLPPETRRQFQRERPIELRPIDAVDSVEPTPAGTEQRFWCRARGDMPDDPMLHQCVAAYASDHTLLSAVLRPHGVTFMSRGVMAASLDHAIWFHRPFRMDQWILYAQHTPLSHGARGLAQGHFFDEHGMMLASMAQEGLVRKR